MWLIQHHRGNRTAAFRLFRPDAGYLKRVIRRSVVHDNDFNPRLTAGGPLVNRKQRGTQPILLVECRDDD